MKKYSKNEFLWHGDILCVLVAIKNDKLDFWQNCQTKSSQKGLSSINIYKFQAKWTSYEYSHGIVCDKVLIFDK